MSTNSLAPTSSAISANSIVGNLARIGAGTGHDQLRLVLAGQASHLIEVDAVRVARHAVVDEIVEPARDVQLHAVRQVAAVGQIEPQHRVARLEHGQVDRHVGLGTGMGLHVGELGAKQLLGPLAGQVLDHDRRYSQPP